MSKMVIVGAAIVLMSLLLAPVVGCQPKGEPSLPQEPTPAPTPTPKEVAKIEITFEPNPVPCENGYWRWRIVLTEVNGVGVSLEELTMYIYSDNDLLEERPLGASKIMDWIDKAYLPAYGHARTGAGFPCQEITHEIVTVTGIDDNGDKIEASGRVDFLR